MKYNRLSEDPRQLQQFKDEVMAKIAELEAATKLQVILIDEHNYQSVLSHEDDYYLLLVERGKKYYISKSLLRNELRDYYLTIETDDEIIGGFDMIVSNDWASGISSAIDCASVNSLANGDIPTSTSIDFNCDDLSSDFTGNELVVYRDVQGNLVFGVHHEI